MFEIVMLGSTSAQAARARQNSETLRVRNLLRNVLNELRRWGGPNFSEFVHFRPSIAGAGGPVAGDSSSLPAPPPPPTAPPPRRPLRHSFSWADASQYRRNET